MTNLNNYDIEAVIPECERIENFKKYLGDLAEETETRIPRDRSEIAERLVREPGMSLAGVAGLFKVR